MQRGQTVGADNILYPNSWQVQIHGGNVCESIEERRSIFFYFLFFFYLHHLTHTHLVAMVSCMCQRIGEMRKGRLPLPLQYRVLIYKKILFYRACGTINLIQSSHSASVLSHAPLVPGRTTVCTYIATTTGVKFLNMHMYVPNMCITVASHSTMFKMYHKTLSGATEAETALGSKSIGNRAIGSWSNQQRSNRSVAESVFNDRGRQLINERKRQFNDCERQFNGQREQ